MAAQIHPVSAIENSPSESPDEFVRLLNNRPVPRLFQQLESGGQPGRPRSNDDGSFLLLHLNQK
ncbi:MAG: hypothetical protein K5651_07235 [Bacteroidales bacterium]|nr:hypothetical protein [Bacteroidales bacterium]